MTTKPSRPDPDQAGPPASVTFLLMVLASLGLASALLYVLTLFREALRAAVEFNP